MVKKGANQDQAPTGPCSRQYGVNGRT
jgi:hypothetical protein